MKNTLSGINGWLDTAQEKINEIEGIARETMQKLCNTNRKEIKGKWNINSGKISKILIYMQSETLKVRWS